MRALSDQAMLDLWERGERLQPLDRGLMVLTTVLPESSGAAPADWPLGRRNSELARWHCAMFGPRLEAWLPCPECGESLEFQMDAALLIALPDSTAAGTIEVRGRHYRLPTSRDLARVSAGHEPGVAAMHLLKSCCLDAGGSEQWTEEDLEEIGERLAAADPFAETTCALRCPSCAMEWQEPLDLIELTWAQVDARAKRLLREVDTLARAYGWTEGEILSLSAQRRSRYLRMVQE